MNKLGQKVDMVTIKRAACAVISLLLLWYCLTTLLYLLFFRDNDNTEDFLLATTKRDTMFGTRKTQVGWIPGNKYTLLDIEELHVRSNKEAKPNMTGHHKILHYNSERTLFSDANDNNIINTECVYTNCKFTSDLKEMSNSDAVIFHLPKNGSRFIKTPPERKQDQVWILSDIHPHGRQDLDIPAIDATWRYAINWTMSYRFESDILWSHGTLRTRRLDEFPNKDYYVAYSYRVRTGMTLITDCHNYETKGLKKRIKDLAYFMKLSIDVYGKCKETKPLPGDLSTVVKKYKFFFMFEEPICANFLSNNLFSYFDLDILFVTYGGSDFNSIFPSNTLINLADFPSIETNIKSKLQMLEVAEFIRRKDLYTTAQPVRWQCDLCHKLNHKIDNQRMYKSLVPVLESGVCIESVLQLTRERHVFIKHVIVTTVVILFIIFVYKKIDLSHYLFPRKQ